MLVQQTQQHYRYVFDKTCIIQAVHGCEARMVEGSTCCRVKLKNLKIRGSFPGPRTQAQFMRQNLQNILISFLEKQKRLKFLHPGGATGPEFGMNARTAIKKFRFRSRLNNFRCFKTV